MEAVLLEGVSPNETDPKKRIMMRNAAAITLAAVLLFIAGCATVPTRRGVEALSSQAVKVGRIDYIPATALVSFYQMQWQWDPITKKAELTKGKSSFIFHVGLDLAVVNGKSEKLSSPVVFYEGAVVIPSDFAIKRMGRILGPPAVVTPPPLIQKYAIRKIVIDPGHGGKDPGAIGKSGLREKDLVLDIAKRVKDELKGNGIDVILTRDRDRFVSLYSRTQIANDNDVDFFVSIHANANRVKSLKGFEVYYLSSAVDDAARAVEAAENEFLKFDDSSFYFRNTNLEATLWDLVYTENREESVELAKHITKAVDDSMSIRDRRIRSARFYVLKGVRMPSVLIEIGYLTNPAEEADMWRHSYRQELASAIVKGILNYKRVYESTDGFTR